VGNHQSEFSPEPPDPSVAEPMAIMLRRKGPFYACKDGAKTHRSTAS